MKHHAIALSCLVSLLPLVALAEETTATTPAVTPSIQNSQPTLTGSVGTSLTNAAPTAKDFITYTPAENPLDGSLGKKYKTVTLTLRNINAAHVEILHGEVLNAVEEAAVLAEDAQHKSTKKNIAGGLFRGVSGIASMTVPYAHMGLGGLRATALTQRVAGAAANIVTPGTTPQAATASGQYQRKINSVVLSPQEVYSFTVIVPKEEAAHIKLVFKDLKSNEIYNLQD